MIEHRKKKPLVLSIVITTMHLSNVNARPPGQDRAKLRFDPGAGGGR
jgi:hypothetical protein